MNNLIIAVIAWYIAEGSGLMQKFIHSLVMKGYLKSNRLKPFDCPMCLAFWFGLFFSILTKDYLLAPINAIICSSIAILISKIFYRL